MEPLHFKRISELQESDAIKFLICDYHAIDTENQLALYTTNGRPRGARRWFIRRYKMPSGRLDWEGDKLSFRAWSLDEALQKMSETRLRNRITNQFRWVCSQLKAEVQHGSI